MLNGVPLVNGKPTSGGSIPYILTANSDPNATQSFTLTVSSPSVLVNGFPPAVASDLFGPHPNADANTAFVKGLYHAVLGRDVQAAELPFWVNQLTANVPPGQVALGIINSREHRLRQVETYYQLLLGRSAVDDALSLNWVNLLMANADETQVITGIMTSAEYTAQHAGDAAFVSDVYFRILGRTAESSGVDYWQNQLANNLSRAALLSQFLESAEAATLLVHSYYAAFLQRSTDAGSTFWTARLSPIPTLSLDQVAAQLLASAEFYQDAAQGTP
jgi:hypothetical protein